MARRRSVRSGFEQRFLESLRRAGIERGDRLTVGFSGGVDSLALAIALVRVRPLLELELLLVHVDHQLRDDSAQEAARCRATANELGVEFESIRLEGGLRTRTEGVGLEDAARRERYLALAKAAKQWRSSTLLLGHQANDQAETVLLHLFRGAGLQGLAGMAAREERTIPWWPSPKDEVGHFRIVRPLLEESSVVIEAYVAESGVVPVEDKSNASIDFDRNWIRHQVLPVVMQRWPGAITSIDRMSAIVGSETFYLEELDAERRENAVIGGRTLCTDTVLGLSVPFARRAIRDWLVCLGVDDVGLDVVARCYELALSSDQTRRIEVGNGVSIVLARGYLTTLDDLIDATELQLPAIGRNDEQRWSVTVGAGDGELTCSIDVPAAAALEIRPVRYGDHWLGINRSVFDDLRSAGIHPLVRQRVLAMVADGGVLLIPAIYPTIRARTSGGPVRNVEVRWRRLD